jgi:hypothetical protein
MATLYDTDFVRWSETQATALRERRYDALDIENLAEEIESLSRRDRVALRSRMKRILQHLLKAREAGTMHTGWTITLEVQRQAVRQLLEESPSLERELEDAMHRAYVGARRLAALELDVPEDAFPESCPFTVKEVLGQ